MYAITSLRKHTKLHLFYVILLIGVTFYYFMQWPIFAGDTDLWYHLNGGRYIVENKSIPSNSFFSFISPPREWVDYYWLFQVVVYTIHFFTGYYGLIILRAIILFGIIAIIFLSFYKNTETEGDGQPYLYITVIFSLYILFLAPRYQLIRPHMFTYLFITVFIYILEMNYPAASHGVSKTGQQLENFLGASSGEWTRGAFKKGKVVFLPLLAVIWCNIHGVEYPVMVLILLAYLCEFLVDHVLSRKHIEKPELLYIGPIIFSLVAIFLTPHYSKLTWVPFIQTESASLYIQELKRFSFDDLASFNMVKMLIPVETAFSLLFITASLSVIASLVKKKIRITHLLLFIGGLVLLTKGKRFGYEFVLLAIPVIKANAFSLPINKIHANASKFICGAIVACLAVVPFLSLKNMFSNPPRYPISYKNLPHGVALFLNHIKVGGFVLNHPNKGGYLQWMVYPKYKIFMDMEVPFLFTDEDFYIANNTFFNGTLLNKVISVYNPSFIAVPLSNIKFKEMIKAYPDYKAVFFDDSEVLYINSSHYPSITKDYALNIIDPFLLVKQPIDSLKSKNDIKPALEELQKIISIYPGCGIANQAIAMIYNKEGLFEKAISFEDTLIKNYPELPIGYKLKADSLKGFNKFDKTIENYKIALKKTDVKNKEDYTYINKEMGLIYFKQERYKKAYEVFEKTVNIFSPDTSYKDIYYYGLFAYMAGKVKEAEIIYGYGYLSIPADDQEWQDKYHRLRIMIKNVHEN